jgi:hypothetical protein
VVNRAKFRRKSVVGTLDERGGAVYPERIDSNVADVTVDESRSVDEVARRHGWYGIADRVPRCYSTWHLCCAVTFSFPHLRQVPRRQRRK